MSVEGAGLSQIAKRRAWIAVLEALTADVKAAEALANDPESGALAQQIVLDWEPPADLGPIPADLLPLAREIQQRQWAVKSKLLPLADSRRKHKGVVEAAQATVSPSSPVYLDLNG